MTEARLLGIERVKAQRDRDRRGQIFRMIGVSLKAKPLMSLARTACDGELVFDGTIEAFETHGLKALR